MANEIERDEHIDERWHNGIESHGALSRRLRLCSLDLSRVTEIPLGRDGK